MGGKRAQKRFSSIGKKEQLKGLPSMYSFMFFKCSEHILQTIYLLNRDHAPNKQLLDNELKFCKIITL